MPAFSDADLRGEEHHRQLAADQLPIPAISNSHTPANGHESEEHPNTIEVPATRSAISEAASLMHSLSISPSQRSRRSSRNSFGATLPIPRLRKPSSLRPGMPPIQPSFDILAAKAQDLAQDKVKVAKNMAFAFDIDGVLVHGDRLIPEAREALAILNGDNELGIKIPYIFLTNGSGKLEPARCAQLSKILGSPVSTKQFIQSHTPMSALAEYYNTVLVVGGEGFKCREIAEAYGFKDVVVPNDIVAWDESIAPYRVFGPWERASARPRDFTNTEIEAILVFSDSRDYATDYQIMMDLLRSKKGRLGTVAEDPVKERIPVYFSQGDLLCPTEHPYGPRMSQGTFRLGFEAMYKAITGVELERTIYGKPERATYTFADEVLANWMEEIHAENVLPENVYMVGDNPQSDIIGGNMYGWNTCLVKTGVHTGDENDKENPASMGLFANVLEAVKHCIKKEMGGKFGLEWDAEKVMAADDFKASAVAVE
ncbi:HAD-superfamily hydrolase [Ascodesmis nigricans]|uniref:HAD-superfamily hydrolase n=1 Tax=Ascodesmis nigricans TaxID=341454 RepID=A0A4V6RHA1_9PEZI|nr:HAD-superfamily hydrolase [Ascodesmis nigricans]